MDTLTIIMNTTLTPAARNMNTVIIIRRRATDSDNWQPRWPPRPIRERRECNVFSCPGDTLPHPCPFRKAPDQFLGACFSWATLQDLLLRFPPAGLQNKCVHRFSCQVARMDQTKHTNGASLMDMGTEK